ncbi:nuclear cap-binding protein subunit 1 [Striga asiatica]|uniref:Nuclear cap-binding protein subunit 1 n=1 Tax=Striga asiatica TaxID=4170 RepID=A0A5A7R8X5_STRAF|nr:nuclear cap-binding protein subunit 1 [Striga asiatica]
MARLFSFPLLHFSAPTPFMLPASPTARSLPFSAALHFSSTKIHGEHTRARAIREWQEYEEAVNRKDLGRALRILRDVSLELDIASTEPTRAASGELGLMGLQRDWEVLDTCLNADDLRLVGSAYAFLKDRGFLPNFGKYSSIVLEGPREVTPAVLESSTGLEVSKFSPKKWGLSGSSSLLLIALFSGVSILLNQGIDIRPNLAAILGLSMLDAIFLGGSCLAQISCYWPPYKRRILVHEAGHLLVAYLMGCPIRGVILDPIVAMQMGIQGQAGTQFWDEKLENELAEGRVSGTAFDRYCMVLFAGIAAEALVYGEAEGGENDENLFRSISVLLEPPLSVAQMSNQARWSVLQSHNLLKWHKHAHRAAVKALEKGDNLSVVIKRIEEAMSSVIIFSDLKAAGMSSWRNLVLRIGEKCSEYGGNADYRDQIETCFGVVRRELSHSREDILSFLLQCAEQLPHKMPLYGTLVGLLNLEDEDFVRRVVENTHDSLQIALDTGNCNRVRILMRFLTVLMCSKVLIPSALMVLFETLLSSAATTVDDDKGNPSWQACADFYISCILSCLPWGGAELVEQVPEEIDRVMVGIQAYMSIRRHVSDAGCSVFEGIDGKNQGVVEQDFLEDLWSRVQDLSNKGWKLDSVPRPHLPFEPQLVGGKSHDFGPLTCPELPDPPASATGIAYEKQKHEAELKYPQRIRRLNIFPSSKTENLQPIDRFVVEEYLLDVLFFLNGCGFLSLVRMCIFWKDKVVDNWICNIDNELFISSVLSTRIILLQSSCSFVFGYCKASRKECASSMVGLPVPFRYEYLMAETIFSQILLLPQPPFKPIYYTLVIMDLCKVPLNFSKFNLSLLTSKMWLVPFSVLTKVPFQALPGAFPAVVAGAVRSLFDKIADLDMECRTRLILWFSHHLSNFQFIWPWDEWAYVLDLPKWAPQRVFVQEVLERESIESAPALEELLPPKGSINFRYSSADGDQTEHGLSSELTAMVKERSTARAIISWIEDQVLPAHGWDITLRVVAQTLLNIGSKSFTHLITVLERYGQVIAKICPDQDKQVILICELSELWKNNAQMTAIAIDRMMGYRLLSNIAIVRWVFLESNVNQFHISDRPWEILRNAITKTFNRITDLRKEISSLEKSVASAKEAASKALAELEDAKTNLTLTLVDGEPVLAENPAKMKRLKSNAEKTKEEEVSTQESLEAKEALFARAGEEIEALFIFLYKSFSNVLAEPLRETEGSLHQSGEPDEMAIEHEGASEMELDNEGENSHKSHSNGKGTTNGFSVGEKEQWCLSTLGYVKAFTRQYASEIWPLVEKLEAEVLIEDVHPLFRKAVYSGLRRLSDL